MLKNKKHPSIQIVFSSERTYPYQTIVKYEHDRQADNMMDVEFRYIDSKPPKCYYTRHKTYKKGIFNVRKGDIFHMRMYRKIGDHKRESYFNEDFLPRSNCATKISDNLYEYKAEDVYKVIVNGKWMVDWTYVK